MIDKETVLSGAPHPGTDLRVLSSPAGYYLGYLTKEGSPYSRETHYLSQIEAKALMKIIRIPL